ncbi:hypothetical protein FRC14_005972 [Serendipita sp. 396]|nr:hypothetical protein FRC14_005972 [Serendipita sp. 396]KAG8772468.1 hypothetical protein FRC15_002710 [Serendipita sp. 397]KAG8852565.1 hypothetical protein FRC20_001482 [Serendipita sp. 405]KAG8861363.1 hypothetical protein FRB91_008229 [Serendipita sp. 411]
MSESFYDSFQDRGPQKVDLQGEPFSDRVLQSTPTLWRSTYTENLRSRLKRVAFDPAIAPKGGEGRFASMIGGFWSSLRIANGPYCRTVCTALCTGAEQDDSGVHQKVDDDGGCAKIVSLP